jgi:hypothetical protein
MQLVPNWRAVLARAWSIRLIVLAGLLSGLEIAVPLFVEALPRGGFALLSFLVTAGAFVARLVAQQGVEDRS